MNRLKVWLFTVLVVAAGTVTLRAYDAGLRARSLADLDARLAAGAAQVGASARSIAREASAAAALASRDERLVQALRAKEAAPAPQPTRGRRAKNLPLPRKGDEEQEEAAFREVARAALSAAEKAFGSELPGATVITAGNREWLARKGEPSVAEGEAMGFLRGAIAGRTQCGFARLNGALFYAAGAPAGEGAGLVVLAPIDDAWARTVAGAVGADLTLSAPDVKLVSTAKASDAQALSPWTLGALAPQGVGKLSKLGVAFGPLKLPALPLLSGDAPAIRARAVAFEGVKNAFAVVSIPTAPALAPVAELEWAALVALAAILVAGFVLGFLVHAPEAPAVLPEGLVAAAARIEDGDFSARAPVLAGKLGTFAAALNKAAELAGPAAAAATARGSDELFARALPQPAAGAAPAPGAFDAVPAQPRTAVATAAPPDLLQAAARAAAPAAVELDEETHWKQVFQDFLRTRASCGEPSEGLTYEKFRLKLEGNRAALIGKYGCRTVKFQVYVKDGKAALKATPVK